MDDADFDMVNVLMRQPVVPKEVSAEQRVRNDVASAAAVDAWRAALAAPPREPALHALRAVEPELAVADTFAPDRHPVEAARLAVREAARAEYERIQEERRTPAKAARAVARKAATAESSPPTRRKHTRFYKLSNAVLGRLARTPGSIDFNIYTG